MTKITPDHLTRDAIVYIRQSTAFQVAQNLESQRRQYALADRARQLGWSHVEVIDADLGRSGAGAARPGFEKLLAAICEGRVGAVLSLEASRLARNGRDWHTLLEFCGLVRTLIIDEDGVYDATSPNDRLLLGMKGTMSEMELSTFRQRSREAMKQKARRGELFTSVAVGYARVGRDGIEKAPDRRVQEAIALVFRKFSEFQTVRQVLVWFRQEKIMLPAWSEGATAERIMWRLPVYPTVRHILTNPVYAGAYAYGRRTVRVSIKNGRKNVDRSVQHDWSRWDVLIRDHHEAYISWGEFERNQRLIGDNCNGKRFMSWGAVRSGQALLSGLLRCARCGKKLHVRYGGDTYRYQCVGAFNQMAAARCITFGGMRVDKSIAKEVVDKLQPLGVEAALAAVETRSRQSSDKRTHIELALQQARYEAARAQRQYDFADPENCLIAGELERRWNQRLVSVRNLEQELAQFDVYEAPVITATDRDRLMSLGQDLHRAWASPGTTPETRKKIIRTIVSEVVVDVVDNTLDLVVHWQGGDHTRLSVRKNGIGRTRRTTDAEVVDLVRALARQMPDQIIAAVLNRSGKTTSHGNGWTRGSVRLLRKQYDVAVYCEGERAERGEATIEEAAAELGLACPPLATYRSGCSAASRSGWAPVGGSRRILNMVRFVAKHGARRSRRPARDPRQQELLHFSTT